MKIDLHCHTKKIKAGDAYSRNVDSKKFAEKVCEAEVQIVAITNHNHFDIQQYEEFKNAVGENCTLWPGVELDIKGKKNRGHMIVIANPDNVELFNKKVKILLNDSDVDKFVVDLKMVFDNLDECDVIYIPHFHKEPRLAESDIQELNNMLLDKSRLFKETSDYRSLGVFSNFDYSMIIGSDVQDWNYYESSKFADIRLPIRTFKQFCLLAKKDKQIINTLLNNKTKVSIKVSPHKSIKFAIPIYEDINILFGQKGTGKSEILKSLKSYYEEKSILFKMYTGNDKESDFEKILNSDDMKRDPIKLGIDDCSEEFSKISEWQDKKPVAIKNYIDWIITKDNNANKSSMKITNAVTLDIEAVNKKIDKDYKYIKEFLASQFFKININSYLTEDESSSLNILLDKLANRISKEKIESWKNINTTRLTNFSIDKIKQIADKCSDTVSKPSNTGFTEFCINRFELYGYANHISQLFQTVEFKEKEYLGEIEGKGSIFLESRYRLLCDDSRTSEFSKGIKKLKQSKNIVYKILNDYYKTDVISKITEFKDLYDLDGIKDITYFIGTSKGTVQENGEEYLPSSGERGILLLQRLLDSDCDVYILDEPELGMGNSYINSSILPKIIQLAKGRKTVIVATHNANIAVRTLPYVSIFRCHEDGKYSTYIGNPFSDELVNIENITDSKNWTKESMHTLEGGRDAFYERKDIYESGRKDN